MKYDEIIYEVNGKVETITLKNYQVEELEKKEEEGQFFCPGKNCNAKLCLVHSSKNGGRTCFFKAVDDEMHSAECDYKIENHKEKHITIRTDGVFTEQQVNDAVRRIANDYTKPVDTEDKKEKNKKNKGSSTKKGETNTAKTNISAAGGRIVYGEDDGNGITGRMRRRYTVNPSDVGIMTTLCGSAKSILFNRHKEMIVQFKDERLSNIQVKLGAIYEHNNPTDFANLSLVKEYFEKNSNQHDIIVAAGGLVNIQNGELILELQANGSLRIDNQTVMKLAYERAKENVMRRINYGNK